MNSEAIINKQTQSPFESFLLLDNSFGEEYQYLKNTPDFKKIHVDHLKSPKQLKKLKALCENSLNPYCNIILGLYEEFGILDTVPNHNKALSYYKKGADVNEPYCLYRLFYIYRNENEKFGLEKQAFLQFSYLFQSAAYFDEKDNRFSDKVIDPILHLAVFYDCDKEKMDNLVDLYLESLKISNELTSDFLKNWFIIKFPASEELKKTFIDHQKELANLSPEAAYHIGDNHRWGGETLEKDSNEAEKYLSLAANHNLPKAIESLAIIYIEENDYEKATFWLEKGAALGSYLCIKFLGEYEISGKILPKNLDEGLKKLKHAFYIGDFWAAWTIIIVYKYIKNLSESKRNKKVFKYSNILFSSKDIMGNIVYITIRHSSLATCYEKAICLEKNLKIALNLHFDCLSEIKRECWKGYTYYKIGKLHEKMNNKAKADEFYYKGFKARSDFIKKEHKKEPPHYYNYAKMFEYGRGVMKNLELAQKYYKLGAEFNSFLSFHQVYGEKCKNRLQHIEKELFGTHNILDYWSTLKKTENKKLIILEKKHFGLLEKLDNSFESSGMVSEMYNGISIANFNESNDMMEQKLTKSVIIYKFLEIDYEKYWLLIRNIFVLDKYPELNNRYPKILGVSFNNKAKEITIICSNEPKLIVLENYLKICKPSFDVKSKIINNILALNYKSFVNENNQLLCNKLTISSFLIHEKDNSQIYFNLPLLLNGEIVKNDENKLINDLFLLIKEIMDSDKEKKVKLNEISDPAFKNLCSLINNNQKNWSFDDLHSQLSLSQKNTNKSKFFNY